MRGMAHYRPEAELLRLLVFRSPKWVICSVALNGLSQIPAAESPVSVQFCVHALVPCPECKTETARECEQCSGMGYVTAPQEPSVGSKSCWLLALDYIFHESRFHSSGGTSRIPPLQYVLYRTLSATSDILFAHHSQPDAKAISRKVNVPRRNLRVTNWLGTVPAIGICTFCNREFKVLLTAMKRVADAQESLRVQFTEHKCKGEMTSANASSGN
jgi:hypothetical protein